MSWWTRSSHGCASKPQDIEAGYALVEALVAAAIAAGVLAAAATGLGATIRGARAADAATFALLEAETIAARLRVGMNDSDVLAGFPDWTLERRPVAADRGQDAAARFVEMTARRTGDRPFSVTTAVVEPVGGVD